MDRISHLPESIVHHILSFLKNTPAELVRMSVLSKSWFNLTASFPFLDFNIRYFRTRESFFKYVEYATSRFCHHNLTAHTFLLYTEIQESAELDVVNRCLELVLKNGVRELVISFTYSSLDFPKYRLPNILLSVSVLESLTICDCDLPSSLMLDAINFKSLIQLKLIMVPLNDEVITYLATSCPLLQVLDIDGCSGFKRVCVYGHQNLQKLRIIYDTPLERIDIEAPNLSSLTMEDEDDIGAPRMNLASCKNLTTVSYFGCLSPYLSFADFVSSFPFIENLYLAINYNCNILKLSSPSLRTFMLHSMCDFEDIEFITPNLVFFSYPCGSYSTWHTAMHSTHLKASMQCYPNGYTSGLCFQKLRRLLDKQNGFKVLNLYINAFHSQTFTELEKLKAIELPPYELEHVELKLDTSEESSAHVAFVNVVLWCCRPRSLTLRSSVPFEEQSDVVEFTYKKLLEQVDQGHTKIQIVSPSSSEAQKHLMDLKSLSMASPREGKAISFIKEEGTPF
ncbi:putative leucine-rich repeat domain superfamily, F-box-like domain superfamily [Helianthus annuus]|uniref:F-box/LRR-repeat protein At4g14096-like n=1 Tax=Helianthus annuus TaxID=4232 RepID=UPI000B8FA545|nr:F-box/LRR-repeat protein At4g14096-like [Helianthus annuus]KAJ0550301.1 putative leucine-rich repeat domain superfamily, F-box-like domain superfamily [Helianthus annuus]KAJ0556983.1 putative leucine-rich repeat domain superfamily, F-box-like domain superfamily [Helianthus annuus]KAJ0563255.1 putative leucine-rich repeat domain superfamily, F-box-like domain superfamily [Helianthus annuus]KAJ0731361.1 putative leucine-rich repeat domain superfamily, F-box-like domain superfamily [Helianthus 